MKIYTTKAAAKALGITTNQIDALCAKKQLSFTYAGRDRQFTDKEIRRYQSERKPRGRPALKHPTIEPEQAIKYA